MRFLRMVGLFTLMLLVAGSALAVNLTFQVNMSVQQQLGTFDSAVDSVGLNGSMNDWGNSMPVIRMTDDDEDMIYTATVTDLTAGEELQFKFVIALDGDYANLQWEGVDDRILTVPDQDANTEEYYFDDQTTVNPTFPYEIIFQVDMSVAIGSGYFDPAVDAMCIRGGHEAIGNWGGYTSLFRQGTTDIYANEIQFDVLQTNTALEYKYFIDFTGNEGPPEEWEEPPGGNRMITPTGDEPDSDNDGFKEIIVDPVYWNDNPGGLDNDLTVQFVLDGRPAIRKHNDVGIPGVTADDIEWFIVTGPWDGNWTWTPNDFGTVNLMDDGVAPDAEAGDSLFTGQHDFPAGTPINFVYKYGANGVDNEAPSGANRFVQLDDSEPVMIIADEFGNIPGTDLDTLYDDYLVVRELLVSTMPREFELKQNYPNPFNPSTQIQFNLPAPGEVMFRVFNVTGQEVYAENLGRLNPGAFQVTFNGSNLSSGIYFYRLEANGLSQTMKMMLAK